MLVLDEILQSLKSAAISASEQAYCPYSNFTVGAIVYAKDGSMYEGCNVENASYGLTICAERAALFHAISKGVREIQAVAIYTPTPQPTPPCGACRQVLSEFGLEIEVYSFCDGEEFLHSKVSDLLPSTFDADSM